MILFISDLHLSASTPELLSLFQNFLANRARQAEALYILGDLFEAWVGDDDGDAPGHREVIAALRNAADSGLAIYLQCGNRDFLLGNDFAAAAGITLLPDPYVLSLPTWQFVLSHGDQLCSDDRAYQAFRLQVRAADWQAAFLARPLTERRALAQHIRGESERNKQEKAAYLMDLNAGATDDFLRQHGYATFIHGHTHQPATHQHLVDGIQVERWVLADWHDNQGECLIWDGEQLIREAISTS